MNNELEKFKKNREIFGLVGFFLILPISALFILYVIFANDKFGKLSALYTEFI